MDDKTQTIEKSSKSKPSTNKIIMITTMVLLLAAAGFGIYKWQASEDNAANLQKQLDELQGQNSSLQSELDELKGIIDEQSGDSEDSSTDSQTSTQPEIKNAAVSLDGAVRFNIYGAINTANTGVAVKVSVTNPNESTLYISKNGFRLQDQQCNRYNATDFSYNEFSKKFLPDGYVALESGALEGGQSVTGTLYFDVPDLNINSFNLLYGSSNTPVTIN